MQDKLYPTGKTKSNNNCPSCGFHISHHHSFEAVLSGKFDNERNGGYTAYRNTPIRASTVESDVLVPLMQSAVWAIASALPAIPVSLWMRYEWYFPFAVAAGSMLVSWISAMKKTESTLSKTEEFAYTPNENDGARDTATVGGTAISLEIKDKSENYGASLKIVDLPPLISERKFHEFCRDILAGKSLARQNWAGDGKPFSRDQYDQLIAKMLDAGLIFSLPGKGKKLTTGGKGAIRAMIRQGVADM